MAQLHKQCMMPLETTNISLKGPVKQRVEFARCFVHLCEQNQVVAGHAVHHTLSDCNLVCVAPSTTPCDTTVMKPDLPSAQPTHSPLYYNTSISNGVCVCGFCNASCNDIFY